MAFLISLFLFLLMASPFLILVLMAIPLSILCLSVKDTSRMTPGQQEVYEYRRHRKKRVVLIFYVLLFLLYVVFAFFDATKFKLEGYRGTWDNPGKRVTGIANLQYALSPDRKEIVLTYEIVTKYYDSVSISYYNPRYAPDRVSSVPTETHIPLDSMSDAVVKCSVEVVVDPAAERSYSTSWGVAGYEESRLTCFRNLEPADESSLVRLSQAERNTMPDGLNYRLTIHPEEAPLPAGCVAGEVRWPHESLRGRQRAATILMIPYDRNGDRYVMLSGKQVFPGPGKEGFLPTFFSQIKQEHPEVVTTTWDTGVLTWCKRILLVPLGFFCDMIYFPYLCIFGLMLGGG